MEKQHPKTQWFQPQAAAKTEKIFPHNSAAAAKVVWCSFFSFLQRCSFFMHKNREAPAWQPWTV
jgi:hypothetical protein